MDEAGLSYRPHPRNSDFVWRDANPPGGPRRLTAEQIAAFNTDGFFRLKGVFTTEEIAEVTAAIDPLERAGEASVRERHGGTLHLSTAGAISFTIHLARQSDVLRAFAAHPVFQDIGHDLIGDAVRLYWDQSVYKKTEASREFPWHQDNGYTFIEPQQYVTCWTPLVDVDEQNGCPWIAPGLHRLGTLEHRTTPIGLKCFDEAPDAVCVPARAGDVIVFSSLSPHRTGPNLRTGVRKAYILQYAPDGAHTVLPDGRLIAQDHPDRQFRIL